LVAAKNKYPIEKLCLFYPALCIPDDIRAGRMMNTKFDPNNVPDTMRCGPMKVGKCYAMDVMNMDSFEEIKSFCKFLVVNKLILNLLKSSWRIAVNSYL